MHSEKEETPIVSKVSEFEQAVRRAERARVLVDLQALVPHELKCRCGKGDVFGWQSHLPECPRYQVGSMLATLTKDSDEEPVAEPEQGVPPAAITAEDIKRLRQISEILSGPDNRDGVWLHDLSMRLATLTPSEDTTAWDAEPSLHSQAKAPQLRERAAELHAEGSGAPLPEGDEERQRCPDDGYCHHGCRRGECWRVHNASPLLGSGFEEWPEEIVVASATRSLLPNMALSAEPDDAPQPLPEGKHALEERYVALQTIRERLLSNEAHEAALDAQIRMSGHASDRATEAAIVAAFDRAFPDTKDKGADVETWKLIRKMEAAGEFEDDEGEADD